MFLNSVTRFAVKKPVKLGDLVKFETGVGWWELDYEPRNPGVVTCVTEFFSIESVEVYWSNGDITTERPSQLRRLK